MTLAWRQSLALHAGLIVIFVLFTWALQTPVQKRTIRVTVQEVPKSETKAQPQTPEIQMAAPPPPAPKARRVFGLNNKSIESQTATVEVKAGNTLATEVDQEKLKDTDAAALPVPAEEYLVSRMPRLKAEVRIPYPAEAKARNVEGAVVMSVLIDATGKVRQAEVLEGPGYGLNEAALKAIYSFEFEPALIEMKPVAVRIRYAYRFVLN